MTIRTLFGTLLCLAGAGLLVLTGVGFSIHTFRQIRVTGEARSHAYQVMDHGNSLLSSLKDAETGYRGYLLTGDRVFLEPYLAVRDTLPGDLTELRGMTTSVPARERLDAMAPLVLLKLNNMAHSIQLRGNRAQAEALLDESRGHGKSLMDAIRVEMAGYLRIEQLRFEQAEAAFQRKMGQMLAVISATSLLSFLLVLLFAFTFFRGAQERVKGQVHVETKGLLLLQQELNARLQLANATLQENEARLDVTLNSIGDAVLTTDSDGRVVILNPVAEQLTGWTQALALGRPVEEIFHIINQETRKLSLIPVQETLALGTLHGLANHTVLVARDGRECAIADSCAPIRTAAGAIIGAVLVFRDVTEEDRIRRDLQAAMRLAEKASLAKSDFLSSMSHEIRTPMNAIIGMSYLALKTELTPRQRDYLKKIKGSGQHLLGIINDILDFSKIEADKLTIEHTEFELEKVLDNVANLIADKTSAKGLELVFDIDPNVPASLIGDPLRLGQILINYGNNAVKFTEAGEVDIIIRLKEQNEKGALLYFGVRDTGIGLSEAEIGRLFQSFSQADPSITRKFGGTGLGLAISKKLADLMGGEVGVVSEPGKGSTFWFTAFFGKGTGHQRKLTLSSDLHGKRVLVVDDNEHARLVLGQLLESMSFKVDQAESGQAALTAVAEAEAQCRPYEIVFLDWQMPGLDGIETARRLGEAQLERMPHLMLVTAYGREDVLKGAETTGIRNVLVKPVSASMLFDGIVGMLGAFADGPRKALYEATDTFAQLAALKGARVLLVEDNELNQEVATELLRDAGFQVEHAGNGQLALALIRTTDYALVLMDVQMPVMDGLTATRMIRREEAFKDLPVVAMTANAMVGDRERCLAAGMNDHIAKPIEPEDLWKVMLKWIKPRSSRLAKARAPAPPPLEAGFLAQPIAGLDMATALRRVLGKRPLYLSMLRKFKATQELAPASIRLALEGGDWDTAERLAHTLKGVAGNIGATLLQPLAERLEAALGERRARTVVEERLTELEGPLGALLEELASKLHAQQLQSPAAVDPERLMAVCGQLRTLLAEDDGGAGELLETQADLLGAAFPAFFPGLADRIRSFDFEGAQAVLDAALAARG